MNRLAMVLLITQFQQCSFYNRFAMVKPDSHCAFSSAAPQIWNHILTAIRASASLDSFKSHLKTHYFASP